MNRWVVGSLMGVFLGIIGLAGAAVAADPGVWEARRSTGGERVRASLTIDEAGVARPWTARQGFRIRCGARREIVGFVESGDVSIPVRADGTFRLERRIRLFTNVTGHARAVETYSGRVEGSRARLRFSTRIDGTRADCRKTIEWSLRRAN